MVVCNDENSFCAFTLFFGTISVLCLILIVFSMQDTILLKFNDSPNIHLIFIPRFLCITMTLQYFIPYYSTVLFFIKEYILLLSYCATAYYFIFQASFLLIGSKVFKWLLNGSLIFNGISLGAILINFILELVAHMKPMPCDSMAWVIMRIVGLTLSLLSMAISAWIQLKINSIGHLLDKYELKDRIFYLW